MVGTRTVYRCTCLNANIININIWITKFTCSLFKWLAIQIVFWIQLLGVLWYWHQNSKPFNNWTNPHHLNTGIVPYSDPHCIDNAQFIFPHNLLKNGNSYGSEQGSDLNREAVNCKKWGCELQKHLKTQLLLYYNSDAR